MFHMNQNLRSNWRPAGRMPGTSSMMPATKAPWLPCFKKSKSSRKSNANCIRLRKKDRCTVRQEKSLPILHRIGLQLQADQTNHLPKSGAGKSHQLHLQPVGQTTRLHGSRQNEDRQQPRRKCHSTHRHREKELALLR